MSVDIRDLAATLGPVTVQEYLRSRGWHLHEDLSTKFSVIIYRRDDHEIDIPQNARLADYPRRMAEVLELLAAIEHANVFSLIDELTEPAGDRLAIRIASDRAASGTLPLLDALRLREAARNMLLAAAHSVLLPQTYFPRMSRTDATQLLATVHEGQSQRGSYVSRFIVPVEPAVGEQSSLFPEPPPDPFARRVVRTLMHALEEVRQVRSVGALDPLLSKESRGVSGNLLAALAMLEPTILGGELHVAVSWSRNRPAPPPTTLSRVSFSPEALSGLGAVADAMRDRANVKGFDVIGYVTRLDRDPKAVDAEGEVVIVPSQDAGDLGRIHVRLDVAAYRDAIEAHRQGSEVRVLGTLSKAGRRWVLSQPSGFEIVSVDADADNPRNLPPPPNTNPS